MASAQTDPVKTDSSIADLPDIVVSATRRREKILQAPVSIEKMTLHDIRQSAQPSFFDAIGNIKGIQMITPSLGFRVINARGFTNTTNVRFVQMVDGMDIQAPHIGAPIANTLGPSDLDISSVEIIPGSSSAIYGMNAINGTADFMTKNPFIYQGLDVQQKTGVNHLNIPSLCALNLTELCASGALRCGSERVPPAARRRPAAASLSRKRDHLALRAHCCSRTGGFRSRTG